MMRTQVAFSVAEAASLDLSGCTVVVTDVLRATSTIVAALAAGARAIYPTAGSEEAVRLASSLGREDTLLCGERKGLKIEGFHLGNSPSEFTRERVQGKRLVMSTTNGTKAFQAASAAERVLAGAFLNLGAVARAVAAADDLVVLCAGREDRFGLEDAVFAGLLLAAAAELRGEEGTLDDSARAVLTLSRTFTVDAAFLQDVDAGRALREIGLEADLEHCARVDLHDIVPVMQDRVIRVEDVS